MFGVCKKKGSFQPSPLVNACRCSPKVAYDSEKFPYKDFPPPQPPNGRDDLWELQFCRWWGWNWVRKKEIEGMASPTTMVYGAKLENCAPREDNNSPCSRARRNQRSPKNNCQCYKTRTWGHPDSPLPTKRELKDLCKCLIFQKPSRELPPPELQNLYNTPSHSVVVERERYSFNRLNQNPGFEFGCPPKPNNESRRKKKFNASSWCDRPKQSTSSEEIICTQQLSQPCNISTQCRPSTEESMEYLTVRMQHVKSDTHCPCHSHVSKKRSVQLTETQTVHCAPVMHDIGCQCTVPTTPEPPPRTCLCGNEEQVIRYKGKKKKTLCICVCCCNCCKKDEKEKSQSSSGALKKESSSKLNKMESVDSNSNTKPASITDVKRNVSYQENAYVAMPMSYSLQPPPIKQFSKFGNPSQNYPWLNTSFSNQTPISILKEDSFTSPISGKTYNFAALQFSTNEQTTLPNLLDATEDLEYLKSIQSSIKNETEQQILFDAVCDALLSEPNTRNDQSDNLFHGFHFSDHAKDFQFTSEFPDFFQWAGLNKPSESDNKMRNENSFQSNQNIPFKESNFEYKPKLSKSSISNRPTEQDKVKEYPKSNAMQISSNNLVQKDSGFDRPISKESLKTQDEKENFARGEINALIDQALDTTANTKGLENEVYKAFQIPSANLGHLSENNKIQTSTKILEINQKLPTYDSYRKILKPDVASLKEKPDFSKTGLLSAERRKIISKKMKRALSSSSEYTKPKKYKPDKRFILDYKSTESNVFEGNLVPRMKLGEPCTAVEATGRIEYNQELKKPTKISSSLDNILAKINKIVHNVRTKNDKAPLDNTFLSEQILKNDQLNTIGSKKRSYEAFSLGVESNRSEISSKNEIFNEKVSEQSIIDIDGLNLENVFSRTSTAEGKCAVTLDIGKKKKYSGKKSLIPIRRVNKN